LIYKIESSKAAKAAKQQSSKDGLYQYVRISIYCIAVHIFIYYNVDFSSHNNIL
jgi:hypothetical protein